MNPNVPPPPNAGPPMYVPPTPQPGPPQGGWPPSERTRHSGLSIGGFVLSLVGAFIAWIPYFGFVGTIGAIFGIAGLLRANQGGERRKLGLAIAAIAIGCFDLIAATFWLFVFESLRTMSCPHVYAFDGRDYRIDADPLSGSLFAAAESDDLDRLEHLETVDGHYRIRIADDLQETDHIDRVALRVVDHPPGDEILPSQAGELLRVAGAAPPIRATDAHGRDALAPLIGEDDAVFASIASDFDPSAPEEPREHLTLEFARPPGSGAVLALRLHNTPLAVDAFSRYLAQMGPGLDSLLRSAQDSQSYPYKQRIADELRRLGLLIEVEVWTGSSWEHTGQLRPIGPAVLRDEALSFALPASADTTTKARLTMTPLFWEIDRARLAPAGAPVEAVELRPASCEATDCNVWLEADQQRHVLNPGEGVNLAFDAPAGPADGMSRTVLVSIRGFYEVDIGGHGWMDPFAILAHRRGATSLPRFAVRLAQERQRADRAASTQ